MRKRLLIVFMAAVMTLSVAACGKKENGPVNSKKDNMETEEAVDDSEMNAGGATSDVSGSDASTEASDYGSISDVPLYENITPYVIDLNATGCVPGVKNAGTYWDDTLFNRLEDVDPASTLDGQLSNCKVSRTLMQRADGNQELIEYEIYSEPVTNKIVKIVALDFNGFGLYITDFYFDNDKINFMYERYDTVYTPSYASIHRIGERHYFRDDAMVHWRINWEPDVIHDYVLAIYGSGYLEVNLFECAQSVWDVYETDEVENLNLAYNTYNAITQNNCVGKFEGTVRDTLGYSLPGAVAEIRRNADNQLLYRFTADDNGAFDSYVYLDDSECYMVVKADETIYKPTIVKNVVLSPDSLVHTFNDITMFKLQGDTYVAHINVFDAMSVSTDDAGNQTSSALDGATVTVRENSDNTDGTVIGTYTVDGSVDTGMINASLMEGNYTLQIDAPGYATTYSNITVLGADVYSQGYLVAAPSAGQTTVVLAWEGDSDLDLTVFTPERAYDGNTVYIGGDNTTDAYGNRLICDNKRCCEVVTLNQTDMGSYRIYVNDYTNSSSVINAASIMANGRVVVYVYGPDGLIAKYDYPVGTPGLVWEVAEISGSGNAVTPCNRTYTDITGKTYWYAQKGFEANQTALYVGLNYTQNGDYKPTNTGDLFNLINGIACGEWAASHTFKSEQAILNIINGDANAMCDFYGLHDDWYAQYYAPEVSGFDGDSNDSMYQCYRYTNLSELEYDAYSITGKHINLSSANNVAVVEVSGKDYVCRGYGYHISLGGDTYYIHDLSSIEYIGNNTWKVGINIYVNHDSWNGVYDEGFSYMAPYSTGAFYLKANSSSYYGFNVIGYEEGEIVFDSTAISTPDSQQLLN